MDMLFWYLLVLVIIIVWTIAVAQIFKKWKDAFGRKNIDLNGPFIMWKTVKGRQMIERVAEKHPKLVQTYGKISVWITGLSMVTMTALLCLTAYLVVVRAKDVEIEPHMLLGLPGLNPLIPLWYGILGLVVAMIVHEFSHGILTALSKVKIISLGILFFILPMGAFVEPDEDGIKKLEKKKRIWMYCAGPASNIIVAGIFALVFSAVLMGSVSTAYDDGGVGITAVGAETPADIYGLEPGMVMVSFDQQRLYEYSDFSECISNTTANQSVEIGVYDPATDSIYVIPVNLTDKALITKDADDNGKGYIGITTMTVSDDYFHPIRDSETANDFLQSVSVYMTLPLQKLSPIDGAVADFYVIDGFWSFLPDGMFWVLANACYWIFWLNLMVGLSNALPAVPLDGGYVFKDWLDSFLNRMSRFSDLEKRTKLVNRIAFTLALFILFLILWQVIGPQIL